MFYQEKIQYNKKNKKKNRQSLEVQQTSQCLRTHSAFIGQFERFWFKNMGGESLCNLKGTLSKIVP